MEVNFKKLWLILWPLSLFPLYYMGLYLLIAFYPSGNEKFSNIMFFSFIIPLIIISLQVFQVFKLTRNTFYIKRVKYAQFKNLNKKLKLHTYEKRDGIPTISIMNFMFYILFLIFYVLFLFSSISFELFDETYQVSFIIFHMVYLVTTIIFCCTYVLNFIKSKSFKQKYTIAFIAATFDIILNQVFSADLYYVTLALIGLQIILNKDDF